jgi:hypothetical protein
MPLASRRAGERREGSVQTAQWSDAEFGGRAKSDAERNSLEGRRADSIVAHFTAIDCAQLRAKTGNIKLE